MTSQSHTLLPLSNTRKGPMPGPPTRGPPNPRNSRLGYFSNQPLARVRQHKTKVANLFVLRPPCDPFYSRRLACALRHVTLLRVTRRSLPLLHRRFYHICAIEDLEHVRFRIPFFSMCVLFPSRASQYVAVINSLIILSGQDAGKGRGPIAVLVPVTKPRKARENGENVDAVPKGNLARGDLQMIPGALSLLHHTSPST